VTAIIETQDCIVDTSFLFLNGLLRADLTKALVAYEAYGRIRCNHFVTSL